MGATQGVYAKFFSYNLVSLEQGPEEKLGFFGLMVGFIGPVSTFCVKFLSVYCLFFRAYH